MTGLDIFLFEYPQLEKIWLLWKFNNTSMFCMRPRFDVIPINVQLNGEVPASYAPESYIVPYQIISIFYLIGHSRKLKLILHLNTCFGLQEVLRKLKELIFHRRLPT